MDRLPFQQVINRQGVVPVVPGMLSRINYGGWPDQFFGPVAVHGPAVWVEAGRGGDVSSGVFAHGKPPQVISIPFRVGPLLKHDRRVARPARYLRRQGVAEGDHP